MRIHFRWDEAFGSTATIRGTAWKGRRDHGEHDHDFLELVVITEGTARHWSPTGGRDIRRGDALILRPGAWHGYAEGQALAGYDCCVAAGLLGHELGWTAEHPTLGRLLWRLPLASGGVALLHLPPAALTTAGRLCKDLLALNRTPGDTSGERLGLFLQLAGLMGRQLPAAGNEEDEATTCHPAVSAVLRLVESDPALPWTLGGLALRAHVDPTYLSRLFRRQLGIAPMAWLTRRRMELAAAALRREPNQRIAAIGARVGYLDANLFSRRFRQVMGRSPSAWRTGERG